MRKLEPAGEAVTIRERRALPLGLRTISTAGPTALRSRILPGFIRQKAVRNEGFEADRGSSYELLRGRFEAEKGRIEREYWAETVPRGSFSPPSRAAAFDLSALDWSLRSARTNSSAQDCNLSSELLVNDLRESL